MKNTTKILTAGLATLMASSLHGAIIYQDNFDNDTLATNTGIGGGLVQFVSGTAVADDGNLTAPSTGHNSRGNFFTSNSFDLTGGFILTVSYDLLSGAVSNGNAARSIFGLVDATSSEARNSSVFYNDNGSTGGGSDAIAFTSVHQIGLGTGLSYDGASVDSSLNVDGATGFQDVVITVDANGLDYSYSVGAATQSGTLASAFDFSKQYRFEGYYQDADSYSVYESVTLEVVPEPSSTALLGLGGLALILRRRK